MSSRHSQQACLVRSFRWRALDSGRRDVCLFAAARVTCRQWRRSRLIVCVCRHSDGQVRSIGFCLRPRVVKRAQGERPSWSIGGAGVDAPALATSAADGCGRRDGRRAGRSDPDRSIGEQRGARPRVDGGGNTGPRTGRGAAQRSVLGEW